MPEGVETRKCRPGKQGSDQLVSQLQVRKAPTWLDVGYDGFFRRGGRYLCFKYSSLEAVLVPDHLPGPPELKRPGTSLCTPGSTRSCTPLLSSHWPIRPDTSWPLSSPHARLVNPRSPSCTHPAPNRFTSVGKPYWEGQGGLESTGMGRYLSFDVCTRGTMMCCGM